MKTTVNLLTGLLMFFLISCEHKDLEYTQTTDVQVVINWKKAPESSPETMRIMLFPLHGGEPLVYDLIGHDGGHISVPRGHYRVLCYNSDTESILYKNMESYDNFEACAPDDGLRVRGGNAPRAEGTVRQRIAKSHDWLYSAHLNDVSIEIGPAKPTLVLYPDLSVCHYRVEIKNVSNLQYISSGNVSGSLSSMSGGVFTSTNEPIPELVTVPFEVTSDGISTLKADFLTFGRPISSHVFHQLMIYIIMPDGSKKYYQYHVTDQILSATDSRDVHIVLNGLSLPKPMVNGGGFQPSMDVWENINVNLPM